MPRVELRDYRKARTPFGSLLRLFRYFRHCRTIMICAVASILVYVAATIAASYCMKPLVNLLKQTGLAPSEVYAKYLALLLGLAGLYALSAVTNYLLNRLMLECSTVIMRALRTIPHLWAICDDMSEVCPDATMLNYVNPMAMNTWAMYARYPHIKQVGLCHSVQGTAEELARDLDLDPADLRYRCAGINHMAFYLSLEKKLADGSYVSIYPDLLQAYADGRAPKPNLHGNPRCENIVRYEMLKKLGYFVTESSEHFAEYTPWFIKPGRDDLLARYKVPLDEYPKRCVEQLANWHQELESYKRGERIEVKPSREYASTIMNAIWTGEPSVVYGNVRNDNLIDNLPQGCCVEVACLVDANGIQPTKVGALPAHLAALMQTNINVQTLLTEAILTENRDYVYYATMMDPHTAAVLGIEEIYALVDDLIASHGDWLPAWLHR